MSSEQAPVPALPTPTDANRPQPTKKPKSGRLPIAPASPHPDFLVPEISGQPTDTSLTINVVPAVDIQISIVYGVENGTAQTVLASAKAQTPTEIVLTNLTPDTDYFYTINGGEKHTFHTARAPGSTFAFDIQGDSHPERLGKQFDPSLYVCTLTGAAGDEPDF